METMTSRAVFRIGLTAAILLGVAFRLHTRASAAAPGGSVRPLDSDSAYHLRRARFAAANFPKTILFDPLMNFPDGGVAIWPPLFDLALAAPARVAAGPGASPAEVARGAAWVPVILAAAAIACAGLLGRTLFGAAGGVVAAFFLAVCPGHVLWSQFAHTDQHVAESLCGLAVLWAFLKSRERPGSAAGSRREAATGLLLAVAVLTWQGAIYWGAIIALSLALERLRTGRPVARAAAWTLGAPAALTGLATAAWWSGFHPPLTYISFGFFQPLFLAALCGGLAAGDLAVGAVRREPRKKMLLPAALVILAAAATLPFARELAAGLFNGIGYSAGSTQRGRGRDGLHLVPEELAERDLRGSPALRRRPGAGAGSSSRRPSSSPRSRSRSGSRVRFAARGPESTSRSPCGESSRSSWRSPSGWTSTTRRRSRR